MASEDPAGAAAAAASSLEKGAAALFMHGHLELGGTPGTTPVTSQFTSGWRVAAADAIGLADSVAIEVVTGERAQATLDDVEGALQVMATVVERLVEEVHESGRDSAVRDRLVIALAILGLLLAQYSQAIRP